VPSLYAAPDGIKEAEMVYIYVRPSKQSRKKPQKTDEVRSKIKHKVGPRL
jgi:hypothetical protein